MEPLLKMKDIYKEFPGVVAINHVDLEVKPAEVLALIGENGAGKSTMMKILGGAYQPEGGKIYIDGKEADVSTPRKALECGISVIYQELNYLKDLSIAENLFLGRLPAKGKSKRVDFSKLREESMKIQQRIGLEHCDPMMHLDELSIGEKQLVEIGKACARNVRVLVMDEPTSALNDKETERLFSIIESMKAQGTSIIYISHKLDEVMRISDRVQVMRDGCSVGLVETSQTTKDELVRMMVGREISDMYPISPCAIGKPILEVRNLNAGMLCNISFTLHAGEVLGLYGLMGAGCEEILQCIFGVLPIESGEILIDGKTANTKNPKESVQAGVVYVPSERKTEGLVLSQSVKANITLSSIDRFKRPMRMDTRRENQVAKEWVDKLNVKTPELDTLVETLSGGNQQKVILAKCMMTNPIVLLLNEPTKGIDVGAKVEIYKLIDEFCNRGLGVIMLSSEMAEVMNTANRILVVYNGQITGEYTRDEATQDRIMRSAIGE